MSIRAITIIVALLVCTPAYAQVAERVGRPVQGNTETGTGGAPQQKKGQECGVLSFEVTAKVQWFAVLPERAPPTRSRLSFDSVGGGHLTTEWDPYDGRGLARRVALKTGKWRVSFWSEAQRDSMRFAQNFAWVSGATANKSACHSSRAQGHTFRVLERRGGLKADSDASLETVDILIEEADKLALGAPSGKATTTPLKGNLMRSFDIADFPTAITASLVEIAADRAKRKAVRIASKRIEKIVCKKTQVLAKTCKAIKSVDLRSLSATANTVARAFTGDLFTLAQKELQKLGVKEPLETAGNLLVLMRSGEEIRSVRVQALLLGMGERLPKERPLAMLAFTLLGHCQSSTQCSSAFLRDVLESPDDYFDTKIGDIEEASKRRIEAFLEPARSVFAAGLEVSGRERALSALAAATQLWVVGVCETGAKSTKEICEGAEEYAQVVMSLGRGRFVEAIAALPLSALGLKESGRKVVTLLLSYLQYSLRDASNAEEAKRAQEQIDRSLRSLLDGSVNRDGRGGDWILSLSSGLRAVGGFRKSNGETSYRGPINVPLALSLDRLLDTDELEAGLAEGIHFELGILDVGNYLRFQKDADVEGVRWQDITSLSLGVGYFHGDDDLPWQIALVGGASPGGDEGDRGWGANFSVQVGLYWPVLDLN